MAALADSESLDHMELNQTRNRLADLLERHAALRGYL
jgi:hypothetical protein